MDMDGYKLGISVGSSIIWSSTEKVAVVVVVVANFLDASSSFDSAVTVANPIALRLNKLESSRKKSFFKSDSITRKRLLDPCCIIDDVRALPLLITDCVVRDCDS